MASSALTRMLKAQGVELTKRKVSDTEVATLAKEYEAGATIRELEDRHELSHGAVLRSLHRVGVEMRAKAPRKPQTKEFTQPRMRHTP